MAKYKSILFLLSSLIFVSCSQVKNTTSNSSNDDSSMGNYQNLSIISPTGAPSLAFYDFSDSTQFETNSTPANIVAMMTQSGKDIVVIDTISGLKAIANGAPYQMLATITFGNFYLASTGNDDDGILNANDKVILFGQNQTADLLFQYLYQDIVNDLKIEYVPAVSDAAKCLASGKNADMSETIDYVLVAQPVLYAQLHNQNAATYGKASVYANIQDEYNKKSNGKKLTQASIFVKKNSSQSASYSYDVHQFAQKIQSDIEKVIVNPDRLVAGFAKISNEEANAKYGISSVIAKNVLLEENGIGLGYVAAINEIEDVNEYIQLVSNLDPIDESVCYA